MTKGKAEILRLRSAIEELETEKEQLRQNLADREAAERASVEAEEDRKFRARQQEFDNLLNRYNLKFPLRFVKLYSNLAIFSNPASGSGQKYKIPRNTDNPTPSSSRLRESSPSLRPSGSRSRDPSSPPRPSGSGGASARSTPPAPRQGAAFSRNTKLPPYCKKFLSGECTYGNQCKFIHVSEGNLFKYLIYENSPNFTFIRRETEIGIVPEPGLSRQLPESPNFRGQD